MHKQLNGLGKQMKYNLMCFFSRLTDLKTYQILIQWLELESCYESGEDKSVSIYSFNQFTRFCFNTDLMRKLLLRSGSQWLDFAET